jgi:integrase
MEPKDIDKLHNQIKKTSQFKKDSTAQKSILSTIMRYYKSKLSTDTSDMFFRGKIKIGYTALVYFSKQPVFRANSELANETIKWLKKEKFISSKSRDYPINSKYLTSTLPLYFLETDLSKVDNILNLKETIFDEYKNRTDLALYIFFRLFLIKKIDKQDILRIDLDKNIFKLNSKLFLLVIKHKKHSQGYIPLMKYLFTSSLIQMVEKNMVNEFHDDINYYESEVKKYVKRHSLHFKDVHNSIKFEYAMQHSQFDLTLQLESRYPQLNLAEVNYLFPGTIPDYLLQIESDNQDIYFHITNVNEFEDVDDEIMDSNYNATKYVSHQIELYDILKGCKRVPQDTKNFEAYLKKYYSLIHATKKTINQEDFLFSIFDFVEMLLKKSDKDYNKKPIKKKTLTAYLQIMFDYCFEHIVTEGELTNRTFALIKKEINIYDSEIIYEQNAPLTLSSTKTYYRLIKLFWKKYTNFKTETSLQAIVDVRRSIVFQDEFDNFIKIILKEEKENFKEHKIGKTFKNNEKAVFCILLYYSGLRKTELRTLLSKNIEFVNEEELEIMVTKENFKSVAKLNKEYELTEKSQNAIRLVRFSIKDLFHLSIVKKHLKYIESKNNKFLFPYITNKGNISTKYPIKESYLSELPKKLSQHTGRYTPLHSLRHSFATYKTYNIFKENKDFLVYELCKIMGHSEPSVTILNYIHVDLLYIFLFADLSKSIPDLEINYNLDLS